MAWYQKLKPKSKHEVDCTCDPGGEGVKPSFWQSKKLLGMVTVFAALMLTSPLYAHIFYPKAEKREIVVDKSDIKTATFEIKGMTCNGCAAHVDHEVNKLDGIINPSTSYQQGNAIVEFDKSQTSIPEIAQAINSTGYSVTDKTMN